MAAVSQPKSPKRRQTIPVFLRGMQRIVDPLGILITSSRHAPKRSTDKEALASDWTKVGDDLWNTLTEYDAVQRSRK